MLLQYVPARNLKKFLQPVKLLFCIKTLQGLGFFPRKPGVMGTAVENRLWDEILRSVEQNVNRQTFDSWFSELKFDGCDPIRQLIVLRAPNQVVKDWVASNYSDVLQKSLAQINLGAYKIEWSVDEEQVEHAESAHQAAANSPTSSIVKSKNSSSLYSLLERAEADGLVRSDQPYIQPEPIVEANLNPKYTFDTFVVGSCNQFAHAASLAIAEAPGKTYNPLFMYGGVGLGKTHLMHAAGHAIKATNRYLKVSYISAEKFMNELINAIRYDKTENFREKYRSIDVLMVDDIQFMAGKERTQEEFFHTFNALYEKQKQIVLTSDCPPREIPTLEERLHSRFEWGLIADMEPPDLETKVAILKRKADLNGVALPDDVALFIASKVKSNIRELEGSLIRLVAIASLKGVPINKAIAQDAIKTIASDDDNVGITIQQIQQAVSGHYRLRTDELTSKSNARQVAVPRQVAMYLCKRLTKHSFPEIGRSFGGKHHTTVMHSVEKIEKLVDIDQDLQKTVNTLMDMLCRA
jgi:chromosomal replication initiator protein